MFSKAIFIIYQKILFGDRVPLKLIIKKLSVLKPIKLSPGPRAPKLLKMALGGGVEGLREDSIQLHVIDIVKMRTLGTQLN